VSRAEGGISVRTEQKHDSFIFCTGIGDKLCTSIVV
jgi:hypothetical protein